MVRLSAVIITLNEEANLGRCLESLSFCDEIIVVDSGSTDKTVEIAKNFTPHVSVLPWRGYVAQKNAANELAQGHWILSLDADEEVSSELRNAIQEAIGSTPPYSAYQFARKTMHTGQWIRYGGWYPNRLVRLFRKDCGRWSGGGLHESLEVRGPIGELPGDLIHHSFESISDQVERNNRYSSLGASELQASGARFSKARLILKPVSKFLETYLWKRGFLDGYRGFIISVSAAYSVFLKWAKLWELENGAKK